MKIRFLLALIGFWGVSNAQMQKEMRELKMNAPVCYASGLVEKSFIPPPRQFFLKSGEPKCDIIVTYSSNFPAQAKTAFEFAVGIWESILESPVPIRASAGWSSTLGTNTLASCGPETYYSNFEDAPFEDRFYAVALAEKITGKELNGNSRYDITANFSSKISWYYGTDGNTPNDKYDFVSVVLHEITHGLGFTGFFFMDGDVGAYAYAEFGEAASFDLLVEQYSGNNLVDTSFYANASTQLGKAMESNSLYADSPVAKASNLGKRPRLYAPSTFDEGSSIYHLNDATYPFGDANSLLTHAVGMAEAIHDPGPLTMGIMEDIGWTNLFLRFPPAKDREDLGPVDFVATIDSYYPIDTASLMVIYSTDSFQTSRDTFFLEATEEPGVFSATLDPPSGVVDIQYYVTVSDQKNRTRTAPNNAPSGLLAVHFGPDTEKPVIEHDAIPYFLLRGDPLVMEAKVNDNLGIDTVAVNYAINDVPQTAFGLNLKTGITYQGTFPFNLNRLNDGDIITYTITAIDASVAKNSTVLPSGGPFSFRVEKIFDPVSYYSNNFNQSSPDFLISDFDIYTGANFVNGSLHSPHPYLSPNKDNTEFNYTTFLKYPIVLQQDGDIAFDEVVLVEPGELLSKYGDDDFWDFVIVEGSKDFGENWYELTNGYDSGGNTIWSQAYNETIVDQVSQAEGTAEMYAPRIFSLLQTGNFSVGDTILIRFRLYSDPYASGWGWTIDNLQIQKPMAVSPVSLTAGEINIYPNPFSSRFEVEINAAKTFHNVRIDVYDSFGRNIYSLVRSNSSLLKESIDLQNSSSGLYLVKVSEDGIPVFSKKMIRN